MRMSVICEYIISSLKNGPNSASFCLFSPFLNAITYIAHHLAMYGINIDGVLGIRTLDIRMVGAGADESAEL